MTQTGLRTVSYSEAARNSKDKGSSVPASQYTAGNNNSSAFFTKMQQSHEEAQAIRRQCRAAAEASAARNLEERVSMDFVKQSIDSAKTTSEFACLATRMDANGRVVDDGAPPWLGHLSVPRPDAEEQENITDVPLPGMILDEESDADDLRGNGNAPAGGGAAHKAPAAAKMLPQTPSTAEAAQQAGDLDLPPRSAESGQSWGSHQRSSASGQGQRLDSAGSAGLGDFDRQINEGTTRGGEEEEVQDLRSPAEDASASSGISGSQDSSETSSMLYSDGGSDESDRWPPRPPLVKFKVRMHSRAALSPRRKTDFFFRRQMQISVTTSTCGLRR